MEVQATVGVKSRYKVISVNPETLKETPLTGWSNNTLLVSGKNYMSTNDDWFNYVQLGTDNTPPNELQTSLLGFVAGTNNVEENVYGAQSSAPYYGWRRKRFRFLPGEASGNLNEVGAGQTEDGDITFRSLLVDGTGTPTTVTPLPGEYVDVVAELRYYPPLGDSTGTITLDGVTYDYTLRAAQVTSGTWGQHIGTGIHALFPVPSDWSAYDGDIGAITGSPSGVSATRDGAVPYTNAYSNNSFERTMGIIVSSGGWNLSTGKLVRSVMLHTTAGIYQVQFDSQASPGNGVPKTDLKVIQIEFTVGWDNKVIP